MKLRSVLLALFLLSLVYEAKSQQPSHERPEERYTQANDVSVFAEYANTSSHIYLGQARNRMIASTGFAYTRRLFRTHSGEFRFLVELHPAFEVSDPVRIINFTFYDSRFGSHSGQSQFLQDGVCRPFSSSNSGVRYEPANGSFRFSNSQVNSCDRRWTYSQGLSPLGFQYAFRRHHRIRPFVTGNAGYLLSTRPVPVANAGAFNFIFAFGTGLELYTRDHRALQVEYRVNHISNNYTAPSNPGIDSNLIHIAYTFGR